MAAIVPISILFLKQAHGRPSNVLANCRVDHCFCLESFRCAPASNLSLPQTTVLCPKCLVAKEEYMIQCLGDQIQRMKKRNLTVVALFLVGTIQLSSLEHIIKGNSLIHHGRR